MIGNKPTPEEGWIGKIKKQTMKTLNEVNLIELSQQELNEIQGGICVDLMVWSNCYPKGQRWFWQRL